MKNLRYILVLFIGILAFGQKVMAASCPEPNRSSIPNGLIEFRGRPYWIYFCHQDFSEAARTYHIYPSSLNSQIQDIGGNPTANPPLPPEYGKLLVPSGAFSGSANISATTGKVEKFGTFPSLPYTSSLTKNIPTVNGQFSAPSIFNFYSRIHWLGDCNWYLGQNQYEYIKNYLRNYASEIFKSQTSTDIQPVFSGNDVAVIKNLIFSKNSGGIIKGNLYFTEANRNLFTRYPVKYCWLGIKTRLQIDFNTSTNPINSSGLYNTNIQIHKPNH